MTHVFAVEAMAECDQRGHQWAWVPSWHDVGFWECARCGASGPAGGRAELHEPPASRASCLQVAVPAVVVPPVTQPVTRVTAGAQRGKSTKPQPNRDVDILAMLATGKSVAAVAARFGLTPARVYQIRSLDRMKRTGATFQRNVPPKRSEERRGEVTPLTPLPGQEGGSARAEQNQKQSRQQSPGGRRGQ